MLITNFDIARFCLPFGDEADDGVWRIDIHFSRMRAFEATHVPSKLNHGHMHAETNTEVRNLVFPRVLHCCNFAFNAAVTKATGDQDSVQRCQNIGSLRFEVLRIDVFDINVRIGVQTRMPKGLVERLVSINEISVFTHHSYFHPSASFGELSGDNVIPLGEVSITGRHAKPLKNVVI